VDEFKYTIKPTTRFKKDLKRVVKQGLDRNAIAAVIEKLAKGDSLDKASRDHGLGGEFKGCRECHICSDWLLIYEIDRETLYLYLIRTGSHSELFGT